MNSTFDLNRFYVIAGNSSAKKSFQILGYKIENETLDDLLQPNYFEPIKDKLNKDDVILVLDLKKELDYKNIEFLIVSKKSLTDIVIKKLDLTGEFSTNLPLPTLVNGSIGTSSFLSRSDHQHPKTIATETETGEIAIATTDEVAKGTDNTTAITPQKLKQQTDKINNDINNRIDSEIEALNSTIVENVKTINNRIDNEAETLNNKINEDISNTKIELNNRIDNETQTLNNKIDEEAQKQEQSINEKINNFINNLAPETIQNYLTPDYNSAIDIKASLTGGYTAPANGAVSLNIQTGGNTNKITIYINDVEVAHREYYGGGAAQISSQFIVKKDDVIKTVLLYESVYYGTNIFCPFRTAINTNNNNN